MADAEARKQMMEAALLLQKEFKNPEPDPFRKKKGLNAASRNRAVPKHPVAPSIPVLANRAPAKIPGLTPSGRTPNPFIDPTVPCASIANPRMPSGTSLTSANNPVSSGFRGPLPGMRDNKAQDWLSNKDTSIKKSQNNYPPIRSADAQPKPLPPSATTALADISNAHTSDIAFSRDKPLPHESQGCKADVRDNEESHGVDQVEHRPVQAGPTHADDLMDLDYEFVPVRNRSVPNPEDLLDLDAPISQQNTQSVGGDTAFDLFSLLMEGIEQGHPMCLGDALERVNLGIDKARHESPEDNNEFQPARFIAAVEGFVKGDSSRDTIQSLLDSAVDALPALRELQALSPQKRCECRSPGFKAVYGLSASKYNDKRVEDTAVDAQDTLFRYVIASAQQGATRQAALQVLLWYHDVECSDFQLAAQAYPILFGACPATAESADADPDGGLVVVKANRNDGHVDKDLDDELLRECDGDGLKKKFVRKRDWKEAKQGHVGDTNRHGFDQGSGYENVIFGYGQETRDRTADGQQCNNFDHSQVELPGSYMGVGHQVTPAVKKGLSSSRWA
ncbi:hypothetical protein VD0002_g5730 [Verticillium dahliae]|uniref:Uncharacterized protein n=2 Tax=Verticillium dahliae TaxID=27337 RepID=G2X7M6_VERDV|nr:uncharacterized protein VDAG_06484 [Verticillium dahliae VdLs.17]KAF3347608.1 Putative aldehyde dehydrogenase-like protein [Verticillium dahliae VDG2]KAH6694548.1 hypothetical protein EV126DRAFT_345916 [Verticillium dahliae]EGY14994.1 hypothetical protein VDAG_06484 [Verticillium dahliae VdLs.17]PNH32335.1 hypothetical protein BJF96_g4441 [Verticillium dahliae]PNH57132.1 hypothetical protein VD0003_g686 [Verticillium dahliae]